MTETTQGKIDELVRQLGTNGKLAETQAAVLPACLAALDGETFGIIGQHFHGLRSMWSKHPDAEQLFIYMCLLIERERVRRALVEGVEVGQLTKLAEL